MHVVLFYTTCDKNRLSCMKPSFPDYVLLCKCGILPNRKTFWLFKNWSMSWHMRAETACEIIIFLAIRTDQLRCLALPLLFIIECYMWFYFTQHTIKTVYLARDQVLLILFTVQRRNVAKQENNLAL